MSAPANWDWQDGPGLLGSAWRYKWLLAAATLVGALLGVGFSSLQPTLYEGVATILLVDGNTEQAPPNVDPDRWLQNQVNVITSAPVLTEASKRHGGGLTLGEVRGRVAVEASTDADVITIHAKDSTPRGAAKLANSVALAYDHVVAQDIRQRAADGIATAKAEEERLRQRLTQLEDELAARPGSDALKVEVGTVTDRLQSVLAQQLRLDQDANRADDGVIRLERATIPTGPVQPQRRRNTAGGALLFLLASAVVAWTLAGRRPAVDARSLAIATSPPATARSGIGSQSAETGYGLRARPTAWATRSDTVQADTNGSRPANSGIPRRDNYAEPVGFGPTQEGKDGKATGLQKVDANGPEARTPPLTPELIVAFDRLTEHLQEVMETLRVDGWSVAEQSLPQLEAEKAAQQFGLEVAVILLDDGRGRFEVAGVVGLGPIEPDKAIRYDPDIYIQVFDRGPRLAAEEDHAILVGAGIPLDAAEPLLMVPLVHDDVGFGLLVVNVHTNGNGPTTVDDRRIEGVTAYAGVIVPTLWSWVLLGRLMHHLGGEGQRPDMR
jgi:capsular polysaccharide biosynthesis protein